MMASEETDERLPIADPGPKSGGGPTSTPVHLSIVSPVYKAEACIEELCRRVSTAALSITQDYEIVLVDDGSPDRSWDLIQRITASDPHVRGVQLTRNFGQHQAITAGLREARGAWVVVMDCDLQDRPEEIPRLYAKAREGQGNECVLARRKDRQDFASKRFTSWAFFKIFNYLTDLKFDGTVANFSIISRRVADQLLQMPESVRFYGGFLQWMGFNNCFVDVPHDRRFAGQSSYTLIRLLRFSINIILAYSDKPLRLCVMAGFCIAGTSFIGGVIFLARALVYGSTVTGWASLIISTWFGIGAIIFTLGVLGLYIARVFSEVKRRPHFVIRTRSPSS